MGLERDCARSTVYIYILYYLDEYFNFENLMAKAVDDRLIARVI